MASQDTRSANPIPSTDAEDRKLPVDWMETSQVELEARASTTTMVLQEILARGEDRYYVHHWGINE